MSAKINNGNKIPVDAFAPCTNAINVTMTIPIPFSPDFDIPRIKDAAIDKNKLNTKILNN